VYIGSIVDLLLACWSSNPGSKLPQRGHLELLGFGLQSRYRRANSHDNNGRDFSNTSDECRGQIDEVNKLDKGQFYYETNKHLMFLFNRLSLLKSLQFGQGTGLGII